MERVAVGVGVVGEHVVHERGAAGDGLHVVVERLRRAVGAGRRHHADQHLADGELAAGVDERVREAVGADERVARRVDDGAVARRVAVPPVGWVRMLSTAMMSPSGSESLATALIDHRHAAARAGDVGAGDRRPVDLVGRDDAHVEEGARLVAGLVGDGVAEREAGRPPSAATRTSTVWPLSPGATSAPSNGVTATTVERAALGVVVVAPAPARATLPPARTSTTSARATGGWSTVTASVTATTTTADTGSERPSEIW